MNILITGKNGFIAQNLALKLQSFEQFTIDTWSILDGFPCLRELTEKSDVIVHLASEITGGQRGNIQEQNQVLTNEIERLLRSKSSPTKLVFASSTKLDDTEYGISKRESERVFMALSESNDVECICVRLPATFGKFARPNHNSVVSTFCYNAVHGLELEVHQQNKSLYLVYIDEVLNEFCRLIEDSTGSFVHTIDHRYEVTIENLKEKILGFSQLSKFDKLPHLYDSFDKELYSTYKWFEGSHSVDTMVSHEDHRGVFTELLKFAGSGQVSFCTIEVGESRGKHYHHTKWERFFVLEGTAKFEFKDLTSGECFVEVIAADDKQIKAIDSTPGILHSIKNVGERQIKMVVWANEIFDRNKPDTYTS